MCDLTVQTADCWEGLDNTVWQQLWIFSWKFVNILSNVDILQGHNKDKFSD